MNLKVHTSYFGAPKRYGEKIWDGMKKYISMILRSLVKLFCSRSHLSLLAKVLLPLCSLTRHVHSLASVAFPQQTVFVRKTFEFPQETLCSLAKVLHCPNKHLIHKTFAFSHKTFTFSHKSIALPRKTLCSLAKHLYSLAKVLCCPKKLCVFSQNICFTPRNFVSSCKSIALPQTNSAFTFKTIPHKSIFPKKVLPQEAVHSYI